ncbi:ABC transporter ATP-binding protein [bacterium]|nr:ABC transporter ATP-binding protein [bacterium]
MVNNIIEVKGLYKDYSQGRVKALRGINLDIPEKSFLALAGPSGSGKTTLLNIIGGLDIPDKGEIIFETRSLKNMDELALTKLRSERIGFIFQQFNLIPVITALENVELPLEILPDYSKQRRRDAAKDILKRVGLEGMENRFPTQLSGGQQQRVAIARALVKNPAVILADEPTANLDGETGNKVVDLMKKMRDELGTAFIFSTHDQRVMDRAEVLVHLVDGRIQS